MTNSSPTPLPELMAKVADARQRSERAWEQRYTDAGGSRALAQRAASLASEVADPVAGGLAHLTLAFHTFRTNDATKAARLLAEAFGELTMADSERYLACAHVLRAKLAIEREDFEQAKRAIRCARAALGSLDASEHVELLYEEAGVYRRVGDHGRAFALLAEAATYAEDTPEPSWARALLALGISSLFIRAREFHGAIQVLLRMSGDGDPLGHVWVANMIAATLRVGDSATARAAALRLVSNPLPGVGSVGYAWGVIALCEGIKDGGEHDLLAAQHLLQRCVADAAKQDASRSMTAYAAFAQAVMQCAEHPSLVGYELVLEWLDCAPEGFPTELLTYMLRWGAQTAKELGRNDEGTRWLRKAESLEVTRSSVASLANILGPMLRVSKAGLLSDEQRTATRHAAAGLTMDDIGTKMGISASKAKRLLMQAREAYQAADTRELVARATAAGEIGTPPQR